MALLCGGSRYSAGLPEAIVLYMSLGGYRGWALVKLWSPLSPSVATEISFQVCSKNLSVSSQQQTKRCMIKTCRLGSLIQNVKTARDIWLAETAWISFSFSWWLDRSKHCFGYFEYTVCFQEEAEYERSFINTSHTTSSSGDFVYPDS